MQVTPVVSSRNITEAAQKRASEIVDRLGNDELYEEEERDRERTVEDIIRSDYVDEPTDNQKSSNREPDLAMLDESELVSEHVAVDPDLNELYLAKAKITEKLLLGDGISDDERNSNEENDDSNEDTIGTNGNIMNTGDHSNAEVGKNTKRMNIQKETVGDTLSSRKTVCEEETDKVSEIPSDSQIIWDNQERCDNDDVRREHRKKQHSESEEGEISDKSEDGTNEENKEKNDINEEIMEDWNFLKDSTKVNENETTEASFSKRTKKKRKKRSRNRKDHRDRSSDKHRKRDKANIKDTKRKHRQDVERGRKVEKENKSREIKEKFEAPLFVNTMRSAAEESNTDKMTSQESENQSVKSPENELRTSGSIPKLNTDMLKKILETVSKGQNQNVTKETSPTTSLHKFTPADDQFRASGTTPTSWNSGQEAEEKNVGPVEFRAQSKGLSIPGAESQIETEAPTSMQSQSKDLSIPGAECHNERETSPVQSNVLPGASHLSFDASGTGTNSQVQQTLWEKKRPADSCTRTPPWEKKKRQKLETQKVFSTEEKQQVKEVPKNYQDGPTILFHGSGSQNTENKDDDNNSMYSLHLNAPWSKSHTNAASGRCVTKDLISNCQNKETREDNVSNIQKSESQTASGSLLPCPKEDNSRPDGLQRALLNAPWQNKATNSKKESVLSQPSPNQQQECPSAIPLDRVKSSKELPPWRKRTSQLPGTKPSSENGNNRNPTHTVSDLSKHRQTGNSSGHLTAVSKNRSPPSHTVSQHSKLEQTGNSAGQLTPVIDNQSPPSHSVYHSKFIHRRNTLEHQTTESDISGENAKTKLQPKTGYTPATKTSVNRSPMNQSKIDHRRNSVEHPATGSDTSEENLKTGLQQKTACTSATNTSVKRRRSSQMSEAASDTSSVTSSSPRSHVGFSPASSTSGASHRQDPERDLQIFQKRAAEYRAEAEELLKKLKEKKTDEDLRKFEEAKRKAKMVRLDIEITELIIHEKKEGNRHQVMFSVEVELKHPKSKIEL